MLPAGDAPREKEDIKILFQDKRLKKKKKEYMFWKKRVPGHSDLFICSVCDWKIQSSTCCVPKGVS